MIAARQIAFGKAAGAKKPYDAEIEYLKGTGTQYINTGIKTANDIDIAVTVDFTDTTSLCWFFGAERGSVQSSLAAYFWPTNLVNIFNRNGHYSVNSPIAESYVHKYQTGVSGIFVDDVLKEFTPGSLSWFGNIFLFTANRGGSPNLSETSTMRIKEMVITHSEEELMHLIPVRKGNIGYMYDRVSGKLFGNQGTGEFIAGPEITEE